MGVESRQPRFTKDMMWQFYRDVQQWVEEANLSEPTYSPNSRLRDDWLRAFWKREPNLAGVLNSVVAIDKNRGWTIIGGRNQVYTYIPVLRNAEPWAFDTRGIPSAGKGWRRYFSQQSLSYYTADIGAVTELGFDGEGGPLRAVYHVDPARCQLTGKVDLPLRYYPANGSAQEWQGNWYMRAVSLEDTAEETLGLGFCAVSRCLELAKIMVAVYQHDLEALRAVMPKGILLMRGIIESSWQDAMEARDEALTAKERLYYGGLSILFGDESLDAKLVALSSLPDGFEIDTMVNLLMKGYALSFGYDVREFWSISEGSLGSSHETQAQAIKASGKGGLDFVLGYQDNLQRVLPDTLEFEFEQRNEQGEIVAAEVAEAWARAINTMAAPDGSGLPPTLTVAEKRQLLAQRGLIPDEWTIEEEEYTATDTDSERWLESPRVRAAIDTFDDLIIAYHWPTGVERVLYNPFDIRPTHFDFTNIIMDALLVKRTIGQVTREYRDSLENAVYTAWNSMGKVLVWPLEIKATLRDTHKALIRELAPMAYAEGLREGGVSPQDMDDEDKHRIAEWVSGQLPFVNSFAGDAVDAADDEAARRAILERIEIWVKALEALGNQGIASAEKNKMGTWRLGNTKEHCVSCNTLNGNRKRLKWFLERHIIPREPGSPSLECGGWECQCAIYDDKGNQIM